MRIRGDMLRFAIAFALRRARKVVRGPRQGLSEEERFLVADDVVHQLQQHGDPCSILPLTGIALEHTGKAHSTPQMDKP